MGMIPHTIPGLIVAEQAFAGSHAITCPGHGHTVLAYDIYIEKPSYSSLDLFLCRTVFSALRIPITAPTNNAIKTK